MRIVDAHHHLWDPGRRHYPWMVGKEALARPFGPDELVAAVAGTGVEATVLVQTVSDPVETREFLAVAGRSGGLVAGVVGWVDLTGDVALAVGDLRSSPGGDRLVGVRHQVEDEPDPGWLTRADVLDGLVAAARCGLAIDLLVRPDQLPAAAGAVEAVAGREPAARFVLDHGAKPPLAQPGEWARWRDDVAALASSPAVRCKLSGLFTLPSGPPGGPTVEQSVDHLAACFGWDRLVLGSDWPVSTLAGAYADVLRRSLALLAGVPTQHRDAVLAGTARTLYGLPDRPDRSPDRADPTDRADRHP